MADNESLTRHRAAPAKDARGRPVSQLDPVKLHLLNQHSIIPAKTPRRGKNTQHELTGLLRQSVHSRLAGCEDTNVAERLAVDPAMRQVVGGKTI